MILIAQFLIKKDHDTLEKKHLEHWKKMDKKNGFSQQTPKNIARGKINCIKWSKIKKIVIKKKRVKIKIKK